MPENMIGSSKILNQKVFREPEEVITPPGNGGGGSSNGGDFLAVDGYSIVGLGTQADPLRFTGNFQEQILSSARINVPVSGYDMYREVVLDSYGYLYTAANTSGYRKIYWDQPGGIWVDDKTIGYLGNMVEYEDSGFNTFQSNSSQIVHNEYEPDNSRTALKLVRFPGPDGTRAYENDMTYRTMYQGVIHNIGYYYSAFVAFLPRSVSQDTDGYLTTMNDMMLTITLNQNQRIDS